MSVRKREREREREWIGTGSQEIEINQDAEPRYRAWLRERTRRTSKPLYMNEAVYGGAETIGISPITSRRYLSKATSPQGDYLLVAIKEGGRTLKQIVWKHSELKNEKPGKTVFAALDRLDRSREQHQE